MVEIPLTARNLTPANTRKPMVPTYPSIEDPGKPGVIAGGLLFT